MLALYRLPLAKQHLTVMPTWLKRCRCNLQSHFPASRAYPRIPCPQPIISVLVQAAGPSEKAPSGPLPQPLAARRTPEPSRLAVFLKKCCLRKETGESRSFSSLTERRTGLTGYSATQLTPRGRPKALTTPANLAPQCRGKKTDEAFLDRQRKTLGRLRRGNLVMLVLSSLVCRCRVLVSISLRSRGLCVETKKSSFSVDAFDREDAMSRSGKAGNCRLGRSTLHSLILPILARVMLEC